MTRRMGRALVGTGAVLGTVTLVAVAIAILVPREFTRDALVPIASVAALPQGLPVRVLSSELVGLDVRAERLRGSGPRRATSMNTTKALPVFLVRDGDEVRGFIGVDPGNRCAIELLTARTLPWGWFPAMLHEVCYGSIYDFAGERMGGPSPWSLDELVLTVKGGRVYARTDAVIPGHMTR